MDAPINLTPSSRERCSGTLRSTSHHRAGNAVQGRSDQPHAIELGTLCSDTPINLTPSSRERCAGTLRSTSCHRAGNAVQGRSDQPHTQGPTVGSDQDKPWILPRVEDGSERTWCTWVCCGSDQDTRRHELNLGRTFCRAAKLENVKMTKAKGQCFLHQTQHQIVQPKKLKFIFLSSCVTVSFLGDLNLVPYSMYNVWW